MIYSLFYPEIMLSHEDKEVVESFEHERYLVQLYNTKVFLITLSIFSAAHFFLVEYQVENDLSFWAVYRFGISSLCLLLLFLTNNLRLNYLGLVAVLLTMSLLHTNMQALSMFFQTRISQMFLCIVPFIFILPMNANVAYCLGCFFLSQVLILPYMPGLIENGQLDPYLHVSTLVASVGAITVIKSEYKYRMIAFVSSKKYMMSKERVIDNEKRLRESTMSLAKQLAHDVRVPFSTVQAALSLVENTNSQKETTQVVSRAKELTNRSVSKVNRMIEDVFSVGRSTQDSLSPVSLKIITLEALEDLLVNNEHNDKKIGLYMIHDRMVLANQVKIGRVVSNLIHNALQAVSGDKEINIFTVNKGNFIRFIIENACSTIPEEVLSKVFENGFTYGKKNGTGVGLSICKDIIESHGGSIHAETTENGVRFSFTLKTSNLPEEPITGFQGIGKRLKEFGLKIHESKR